MPGGAKDQKPALMLRSVEVNDRALSGISNMSLYLPAHPDTTTFVYGPNLLASNVPLRFRCQLDGYEQGWHERSVLMRMVIRFIDANQRDIAEQVFAVTGESPGWTGSFTDSPWIRRKEVITVPAEAVRFWVVISSAGPPEAVGFCGSKPGAVAVPGRCEWFSDDSTGGTGGEQRGGGGHERFAGGVAPGGAAASQCAAPALRPWFGSRPGHSG